MEVPELNSEVPRTLTRKRSHPNSDYHLSDVNVSPADSHLDMVRIHRVIIAPSASGRECHARS